MKAPRVSVIIPAYNQAKYLDSAIRSALAQTYRDYEIIVIDDGSTDDTPRVASQFNDNIRYIRQDNRGLGGARNTGIRASRGKYVALLDSDDIWLPSFLQTMVQHAEQYRDAALLYCCESYIDADGHELPQPAHPRITSDHALYETLLRGDFLVPSAVVVLRSAVLAAGLFDQSTKAIHGCEDWDLWLRLASTYRFAGTDECLVRYRLHDNSLSTNPSKMQRATRAVIEKHFGPDDGCPERWPRLKRIAYGGVYRYCAWTSVLRQTDWNACAQFLSQALQVDPSLSKDRDLFYDLAMGPQPLGYRGTASRLDLQSNASHLIQTLSQVFQSLPVGNGRQLRHATYGTAYFALGLLAYNTNHPAWCRKFMLRALLNRPDLFHDPLVVGDLFKSFVGRSVIDKVRRSNGPFSH